MINRRLRTILRFNHLRFDENIMYFVLTIFA
nr:MAG TPA: hypothetical protein [Caudoviricetes sp.]